VTCQLIYADCLQVEWAQVDAIITDVPYGTTACKWDVVIPFPEMWAKIKGALKPLGAFVTTASQPFTSLLVCSNLAWFKYSMVWKKDSASNFGVAKYRPMNISEDILLFYDGVSKYNPQMWDSGRKSNKSGRGTFSKEWKSSGNVYGNNGFSNSTQSETTIKYPTTVLDFPKPKHNDGINGSVHPTQKPVALYEYLIKTYTNEGDTVLDFCMGSGTTGIACINTGRNFIGIEKNDKYFEIAKKRIEGRYV